MRWGAVALAALASLVALAVLVVEVPRSATPAAAQTPSSADPAQIVRIHNGVYLYWHEPASDGEVTGYDVQHRSGTSGNWGTWTDAGFSGTAQPAVVTGLAADTTYQFRVRAENARGKGAWSSAPDSDDDPARVVTIAASGAGVPNTVKSLSAEAGEGSITVTWTAPHARAGAAVSGYTVLWRYYDEDDNAHSGSAPSIASTASSYTISGLVGGRTYDIWMRAHASGKRSRDSMAVYDVTPWGSGSPTTPTPTATPTPTPTPKPGPRVLGGIAPRGGGAVTVAPGATVRLDLDLVDGDGEAVDIDALPRTPVIAWYVPHEVYANARQTEARVELVFESSLPDRYPRAPLANVAGAPGSALYAAPADFSGRVVVRVVVAAADCPGGGGGTDSNAAAAWDGPCSAEFTITVPPAVAIAAVSPTVGEGNPAKFTISRTGGTTSALTVAVSVSETGDALDGAPPSSVSIPAGANSATLSIPTADDKVRETDSVVTATVTAPAGYVAGSSGSATVTVEDDDPLLSTTLSYDTYDTAGKALKDGSYSFLQENDDGTTAPISTYEDLRKVTAPSLLLINKNDAIGVSRANILDAVVAGDQFKLAEAGDCFTQFVVTEVKDDPEGDVPRKALVVQWTIYGFTGCSASITDHAFSVIWGELPSLGGDTLTVPVMVGIHQLVPDSWTGTVREVAHEAAPGGSHLIQQANPSTAVLSALDYWREPKVPKGWSLAYVSAGTSSDPYRGFSAIYSPTGGSGTSLEFHGYFLSHRNWQVSSGSASSTVVVETRVIAGRPALIEYSPPGDSNDDYLPTTISIMDLATESGYTLTAYDSTLKDIDTLIGIASSLFEEADSE